MSHDPRFRTTKWSVVLTASARDEPGSKEALTRLCETYWYPLYAFVRRRGHAHEEALDLTQGYFLQLLERDVLKAAKQEAGKFRAFLLITLKRYLSHEHRAAKRLKRGGELRFLSLDSEAAQTQYRLATADSSESPESEYEREWARAVLKKTWAQLQLDFEDAGKQQQFHLLAGYLSGEAERPYSEVARELGTTEASVKMAVSRLRRRYGQILRAEIAQTVDDDAAVDDEVRHLLSRVRGG